MKDWKPNRTEFYESAVSMGFYGKGEGGLFGKKDNVRKIWEDIFIKLVCRPFIEKMLASKNKIRILDLGSGSGEGIELLTHIAPTNPKKSVKKDFILKIDDIEEYFGIDISPSMIAQGRANYRGIGNIKFQYGNLEEGLPLHNMKSKSYDIYFSSYGSLSHLHPELLNNLFEQIYRHARHGSAIIFDVHGKYSPAWPQYWSKKNNMLPYTMAYLIPEEERKKRDLDWFNICYWDVKDLKKMLFNAARSAGVEIKLLCILDRSVFVGRHVDTGLLSRRKLSVRYQVNRLLDHGYRGETEELRIDLGHLEKYKNTNNNVWNRLIDYQKKWNKIIYLLEALMNHEDIKIKRFIESADTSSMSDDMKFLTWLFRNADRFPVIDFWASIIGPQVAIILRNIEMSYPEGFGCGHGLVCALEIKK